MALSSESLFSHVRVIEESEELMPSTSARKCNICASVITSRRRGDLQEHARLHGCVFAFHSIPFRIELPIPFPSEKRHIKIEGDDGDHDSITEGPTTRLCEEHADQPVADGDQLDAPEGEFDQLTTETEKAAEPIQYALQ